LPTHLQLDDPEVWLYYGGWGATLWPACASPLFGPPARPRCGGSAQPALASPALQPFRGCSRDTSHVQPTALTGPHTRRGVVHQDLGGRALHRLLQHGSPPYGLLEGALPDVPASQPACRCRCSSRRLRLAGAPGTHRLAHIACTCTTPGVHEPRDGAAAPAQVAWRHRGETDGAGSTGRRRYVLRGAGRSQLLSLVYRGA
jgi:hypothetical protein